MKKRSLNRRVFLVAVGLALAAILAFSLAGCSLFTEAVKSLVSKTPIVSPAESSDDNAQTVHSDDKEETPSENEDSEEGEPSKEEKPSGEEKEGEENTSSQTDPGGEDLSEDKKEEEEPSGGKEEETPASDIVRITSSLTYDKASKSDLIISATHESMNFYTLLGAGISSGNFSKNKEKDLYGSSEVAVLGSYLSTLAAGTYDICYAVQDGFDSIYYEYFKLKITNSKAAPKNVKINYDISYPNVYVTFTCDCGGSHTVTYDNGSGITVAAGKTMTKITSPGDKNAKHSCSVRCSGGTTKYEKAAPSSDARSYLSQSYSFMAHTADQYIEDEAELVDLFQYMVYKGEAIDMKVGISAEVLSELVKDKDGFLTSVQSQLYIPWSCATGLSFNSASHVATFSVGSVKAGNGISSGYSDSDTYELGITSHYEKLNVRASDAALPIDKKTAVTVRNVKELLAAAEAGYRPVPSGTALTLYNKARTFCCTYLTDDMTQTQKLHIIYDYLAGEIRYDYSALKLYNAVSDLYAYLKLNDLSGAKASLSSAMADESNEFSSSMKTALQEILDNGSITKVSDLISTIKDDYMQRLKSFSAEGVFDDGVAVCEGISYAFMLLSRIEGIECYQISGDATNGKTPVAHAWNKVRVNGKWYAIDATWGNFEYNRGSELAPDVIKLVTHRYFMVDESLFYSTHKEKINGENAILNVANGNVDYYKSVKTGEGHSLYIENADDLLAAVKYYVDNESRFIELASSPDYEITSKAVLDALKNVLKKGCSLGYSSGTVFLAYYTAS